MNPVRPVYSNDRKAPRMRKAEFSKQVVTKELHQKFLQEYPEYVDLPWSEFKGLWDDLAKTIREETVTNPLGVKLGSYMGELKFQYLPHKFKAPNEKVSNELGEKVNSLNIITKGKVAKIKWERRWAVKYNKILQFYAFDATREINRLSKIHTDANPDIIRVSRNTLGGFSVWRQL